MNTQTPSGDVSVTAPGCDACGQPLPAGRSRRFCSPACRQAAFSQHHHPHEKPQSLKSPQSSSHRRRQWAKGSRSGIIQQLGPDRILMPRLRSGDAASRRMPVWFPRMTSQGGTLPRAGTTSPNWPPDSGFSVLRYRELPN